MLLVSFLRALRFALQNFWRNIWLSVVTVFILVLTLFSVTFSAGLNVIATQAVSLVKNRVDVSIYFTEKSLEEDVRKVANELSGMPEVKEVTYISKEEALQSFREKNKDNPIIADTLDVLGTNPLGPTLVVKAKDISDFPTILAVVDKPEYSAIVQDRDFEENQLVIERLSDITNRARQIGLIVSLVFSLIAVLVIFNTIRITIYTYREEIGIMKLVGATNAFIRAPFLIESVLYAVLASMLSMILVIPIVAVSAPYLNAFFIGYGFDLLQSFQRHFWPLFGLQLLLGVALSVVSSAIAMTRHLRI